MMGGRGANDDRGRSSYFSTIVARVCIAAKETRLANGYGRSNYEDKKTTNAILLRRYFEFGFFFLLSLRQNLPIQGIPEG